MSSIELSLIGVGPARAGMIRRQFETQILVRRWPRTSGDDPEQKMRYINQIKLAPHERG